MNDKQPLLDFIQSLGLTYEATFQPKPQPIERVKYPGLHWVITLSKHPHVLETTYFQGMAHITGYKQTHKTKYDARIWDAAYRRTCETGKLHRASEHDLRPRKTAQTQPKPELVDVLYSLVSDADVLNHTSFESWASDLGYDTDSRKAEDIYRACLKNAHALYLVIGGHKNLEKLRELYQDY